MNVLSSLNINARNMFFYLTLRQITFNRVNKKPNQIKCFLQFNSINTLGFILQLSSGIMMSNKNTIFIIINMAWKCEKCENLNMLKDKIDVEIT
jgi:hypothetical protein